MIVVSILHKINYVLDWIRGASRHSEIFGKFRTFSPTRDILRSMIIDVQQRTDKSIRLLLQIITNYINLIADTYIGAGGIPERGAFGPAPFVIDPINRKWWVGEKRKAKKGRLIRRNESNDRVIERMG